MNRPPKAVMTGRAGTTSMDIRRTVKGRVYSNLKKLGILNVPDGHWKKITHEPWMDLSIERHGNVVYLSHTNVLNGDLMSDPHVRIMVNDELEAASGMYIQNDYTGTYRTVRGTFYKEDGTPFEGVNQAAEADLNQFILIWLKNIKEQGYPIKGTPLVA